MIKYVIHRIIKRSHFWRDAGFDELSELYISSMLRCTAVTIFMVFVPYYLYQNGYSAPAIFALFGLFFIVRMAMDILAAFVVARFGPKHTMILSCTLQIIAASVLLSVPQFHWHILAIAAPWGAANSFLFIAYHVTFSKIKHTTRAGAEIAHMQTFEKIGCLLGPLVGGVLGSVFGAQYIFAAATILLVLSLYPLFLTSEPVKVHQKIAFKKFPVDNIRRDLWAYACAGIENSLCINAWPFFVAVFVLSGAVYAQLGTLSAIGVLAAVLSAKLIGRLSDTQLARPILRFSAVINALLYLIRPLVHGLAGVLFVNVANEAITAGYRMPLMKGVYAAADDLPGYRIVYISTLEAISSIAKATVWLLLAILATAVSLKTVLLCGFVIAALASVGIMGERFAVYNVRKK